MLDALILGMIKPNTMPGNGSRYAWEWGTTLVLSRHPTESFFFYSFFKNGIRRTKVTQLLYPTILIALDIPFLWFIP